MKKNEVLGTLTAASEGLLFPSESEYPLEPFRWEGQKGEPEAKHEVGANKERRPAQRSRREPHGVNPIHPPTPPI